MKNTKQELRKQIKQKLQQWSLTEKHHADEVIYHKILNLSQFKAAKNIALYHSVKREVDTIKLINYCFNNHKHVYLPRIEGENLVFHQVYNLQSELNAGSFLIPEPHSHLPLVKINDMDLIFVPMLGFDDNYNRLGYGKGYYDRCLANVDDDKIIGLAYDLQKVFFIPSEPHDKKVLKTITN